MSGAEPSFHALARCLPEALLCISTAGEVLDANRPAQRMLGRSGEGFHLAELTREDSGEIERYLRMCCRSRSFLPGTLHLQRADGGASDVRTWGVRLELADKDAPMVLLRFEDKKQATAVFEALNRELKKLTTQRRKLNKQRQLIRRQKQEILDFSAPMIDVWDGVLLVPLFGVLSDAYFDRVLANLLDMVASKATRWVILDMTGTPSASPRMAASMARIVSAVRLLGARCILAGLGPSLARSFAAEAEVPAELLTVKNLHTALAMCLREAQQAQAQQRG